MKKTLAVLFFIFIPLRGFCLEGIEVFTGYLSASLDEKQDYIGIPFFFSFDFSSQEVLNKVSLKGKSRLSFIVELFTTLIVQPDTNLEGGLNFLAKYKFNFTKNIKPYIKGGVGIVYMSQHTREQGSQYNFLPQIGAGFHYFVSENSAISLEYRYRHLSNAGTKRPNKGIETNLALIGFSFFF
ncbi:MAG: hypothetical protein DRP68_05905 [Candidatus Omnitrophota bacterium]|nr:MAG: hypothetical protein DRP68_05905 [Candidatus Omnitrophota bacterium]HDN86041.1 acyloxyacyl hydrolase [Candidatus Omnitrophota bacterium]